MTSQKNRRAGLGSWTYFAERSCWQRQELNKGTRAYRLLPENWGHSEGGWGFNPSLNAKYVTPLTRRMTAKLKRMIPRMTDEELIANPIFRPFDEPWLRSTGLVSSNAVRTVRARILADGIPATSFAAGVDAIASGKVAGNIDYTHGMTRGYPSGHRKWRHSDLKRFAFYYVSDFFKKLVDGSMGDESK